MKIIYISSACYKKDKETIDSTATVKLENNIILFHNSIIEGLSLQEQVDEISSIIGLPISIHTNRKILWRRKERKIKTTIYNQLPFINLPLLKQITLNINLKKYLKKKIKYKDAVVVYDASFVSLFPTISKTLKKKSIKSIAIFADIYDYMQPVKRKSKHSLMTKTIARKLASKTYELTDGFIFLTEEMNKLINIQKKPHVIIEGIWSEKQYIGNSKKEKTILYAGGLNSEYGIDIILDLAKQCPNYIFALYGKGPLEDKIIKTSKKYKNIKYYGLVSNDEIIRRQAEACLLINLRKTNLEYTKYSFPSKIIEYMASGTPILTTKLRGIPNEYNKYLNYVDEKSKYNIKDEVEKIIVDEKGAYKEKAKKAKQFILTNKNKQTQGEKIIKLILKINNKVY